ncbi:dicarboxylate/amino acid:cation symporter [Oceanobacillus sp. CAU 1775]
MRLIVKLLLGIIIGIIIGLIAPEFLLRGIVTFKDIFGQFLNFAIPLIIVFFVVSGIASFGKESGKMLGYTAGIAYASTIIAGTLAFIVALLVLPSILSNGGASAQETVGFEAFFTVEIDPIMGVMTALVLAFVLGIGITQLPSPTIKGFFDEGKEIIEKMIWKVIIPILPFYIGSIFAEIAADGAVVDTLQAFGLVLVLAVAMHWVWLIILYVIAGTYTGKSPFSSLKTMLPAYFTGLGTMSSAATIPVTVRSTKNNKVSDAVADAAVPLSATIHLSGSTITLVTCSVAVMALANNMELPTFGLMMPFILMLGIIMIAAPGVPGGAVIAALGLLGTMLGFDETALGLMIALYMAQDSFGTAANVTGDGAIAMMVDKIANKNKSA